MRAPILSVVMPVYDGAAYLAEAIDSVLAQTLNQLELILVDDGSGDDSPAILRDAARRDARVTTLRLSHGGVARATNAGIACARGEWIARVDQDDLLPTDAFAAQLSWIRARDVDVCGGQVEEIGTRARRRWFPESPEAVRNELLFRACLMHPMLMRTELARENPYVEDAVFDDYELLTRLAPCHRLANLPRVLLHYRRHARQSHSVRHERVLADFRKYRFRYFYTLFPGTPLAEYLPLSRIADRVPIASAADLEVAGRWLERLSALPDRALRQRMARRWRETWERSPGLPRSASRIFKDCLARIEGDTRARRTPLP